ncbi:hypothetical protein ACHAWO_008426 [Cyclotella atomus]|uniref:Amino acid transporter n=1 Tax=Cyclotella atomus TaxID=382360 RepID=A0ABD3NQ64_9STRA
MYLNSTTNSTHNRKSCGSTLLNIYTKHQLAFVIWGAILGIGLGIALAYWTPENADVKSTVLLWVGLLGDLFIRALKCIILPLVFVSIAISVMDMLALGKAGSMVKKTIGLYLFTTVCAVCLGVLSSLTFGSKYVVHNHEEEVAVPAEVRLACSVDDAGLPSAYLTEMNDGSVVCAAGEAMSEALFLMDDVNGYFATSAENEVAELSLSESFYQGLFMQLIGSNMFGLFTDSNFLGVIILAAGFGVGLNKLKNNPPRDVNWAGIITIQLLEELNHLFMMFVHWIIYCAPICILSLVAKAIGSQSDMGHVAQTLGWLFVSFVVGAVAQVTLVYSGLYLYYFRSNPLSYFKDLVEALTLAFASASSAATLPVSLECVAKSGKVNKDIARFVLPLGATINMDGVAIYITCTAVALAYLNGLEPTVANYVILAFCATLGSIGTAPVPASGPVMALTAYNTAFQQHGIPYGFAFVLALDWLTDRISTCFNVCGDMVIASLVSSGLDAEEQEEFMKQIDNIGQGSSDDIEIAKANIRASMKASMLSA